MKAPGSRSSAPCHELDLTDFCAWALIKARRCTFSTTPAGPVVVVELGLVNDTARARRAVTTKTRY